VVDESGCTSILSVQNEADLKNFSKRFFNIKERQQELLEAWHEFFAERG
jgi:hypothetical protein